MPSAAFSSPVAYCVRVRARYRSCLAATLPLLVDRRPPVELDGGLGPGLTPIRDEGVAVRRSANRVGLVSCPGLTLLLLRRHGRPLLRRRRR